MNLFEQQIAEVKISYSHIIKPSNQVKITGSRDIYMRIAPIWPDIDYCETFAVVLLSRSNKILCINYISTGGISGTIVDVKKVMQAALNANSSCLLLVHNHPSGNLQASAPDISITKKIKKAAEFFDMQVLDHIIITSESYYSLADEGLL